MVLSAVETRNRVARELQAREKEKKEQELRELAMRARAERGGAGAYAPPPAAARYPKPSVNLLTVCAQTKT